MYYQDFSPQTFLGDFVFDRNEECAQCETIRHPCYVYNYTQIFDKILK
jgi:hypothetical protein